MSDDWTLDSEFERAWPAQEWRDVSVVIAVSGGADSTALVRAVVRAKTGGAGRLWVAHFNHHLRAAESEADEQFVVGLAENLGLSSCVGHGERIHSGGDGLEAAARLARYAFLQATAERVGARYVVTAHTADDQFETIVQRIFRGTGLNGLAGIRRTRALGPAVTLIRPLLGVRREALRRYLSDLDQPWREDSSNASLAPTRNWLRHQLLPLLEENLNANAAGAVCRLGALASEAQRFVETLAAGLADRAVTVSGPGTIVCDCAQLAGQNRYLVRELFVRVWRGQGWPEQAMGFAEWDALAAWALSTTGTAALQRDFPGAVRAQKQGARLTLARPV